MVDGAVHRVVARVTDGALRRTRPRGQGGGVCARRACMCAPCGPLRCGSRARRGVCRTRRGVRRTRAAVRRSDARHGTLASS
eukprot:5218413-Prymnesium_polylepis.1